MQYSEASFIRDAFIRKHRYPDGFSRERKNATLRTEVLATKLWFTMTKRPCFRTCARVSLTSRLIGSIGLKIASILKIKKIGPLFQGAVHTNVLQNSI